MAFCIDYQLFILCFYRFANGPSKFSELNSKDQTCLPAEVPNSNSSAGIFLLVFFRFLPVFTGVGNCAIY